MVKIEITNVKDNVILKRKEISYKLVYDAESTPKRESIRDILSKNFKAEKELVIVDRTVQETGKPESIGYAKIYESKENAMLYEPDYELFRNGLKTEEKKE